MLMLIGTCDNVQVVPTPVLDDSEKGYHTEERLQVTVKSAANDKPQLVEFRPSSEDHTIPSDAQLTSWMEAGELLRVVCSGVTARPFVHDPAKQYRTRGSEREINGQTVALDTLMVFAGQSATPASSPLDLDAEVRAARGAYKKAQRVFRERVNAERAKKLEAELPGRVAKMREAQAKRQTETTTSGAEAPAKGRR